MAYPNITDEQIKKIEDVITEIETKSPFAHSAAFVVDFIRALETFSFICPRQRIEWLDRLNAGAATRSEVEAGKK